MGKRRKGREILLQAYYAAELSGRSLADCLADQVVRRGSADETVTFAQALAVQVERHRTATSQWLVSLVEYWQPERIGVIERAILSLALTELRHSPDVPWRVVINEACELARLFCEEEAVGFVNGVLDRAAAEVLKEKNREVPEEGQA